MAAYGLDELLEREVLLSKIDVLRIAMA